MPKMDFGAKSFLESPDAQYEHIMYGVGASELGGGSFVVRVSFNWSQATAALRFLFAGAPGDGAK